LLAEAGWGQEPPTLDEIIEGLDRTEKLFFENKSLLIRYERTAAEDLLESAASGGFLLAEWTLAYREDKWFVERRFSQPFRRKDLEVPGKPTTQVVRERVILEWRQSNGSAVVDHFDLGRNIYQ